jgi:hypothetical protein
MELSGYLTMASVGRTRVADNGVSAIDPMPLAESRSCKPKRQHSPRASIIGAIARRALIPRGMRHVTIVVVDVGARRHRHEHTRPAGPGTINGSYRHAKQRSRRCEPAAVAVTAGTNTTEWVEADPTSTNDLVPNYMSVRPGIIVVNDLIIAGGGWTITLNGGGQVETTFLDVGC